MLKFLNDNLRDNVLFFLRLFFIKETKKVFSPNVLKQSIDI